MVTFKITTGAACKQSRDVSFELKEAVTAALWANREKIDQSYRPSDDSQQKIRWQKQ